MPRRARTRAQGLAYAFGKYRYTSAKGTDVEAIRQRVEKRREANAHGMDLCDTCLKAIPYNIDNCPHCGAYTLPF